MKYNIGDVVKVREDLEVGRVYHRMMFVDLMEDFIGQVVIIKDIDYDPLSDQHYYTMVGDEWDWGFVDEMLEDIES